MSRNKSIILKRNDLIEARFTSRTPSLIQNRIILYLASQIRHGVDAGFHLHTFTLNELRDSIQRNVTIPELLKALKSIMEIVGETYDPIKEEWTLFHIIDHAKVNKKTKLIELRLGSEMMPYFLKLQEHLNDGIGFTTLGYEAMVEMNSVYSQRIYELLVQFRTVSHRTISVEDLKNYLGLVSKSYKHWHTVETIINNAQEECAEAGLIFDWKTIKKGRPIVAIEFDFTISEELADTRLLSFGLSKIDALKIQKQNTQLVIDKTLFELRRQSGSIKNTVAWLKAMLLPKRAKRSNILRQKEEVKQIEDSDAKATKEDFLELFSPLKK